MATDELVERLSEHGDRFVEALVAVHVKARPSVSAMADVGDPVSQEPRPAEGASANELDAWADRYVAACIRFWTAEDPSSPLARVMRGDAAVRSIAEDVVGALRKAQYLFAFE